MGRRRRRRAKRGGQNERTGAALGLGSGSGGQAELEAVGEISCEFGRLQLFLVCGFGVFEPLVPTDNPALC